MNLSILHIKVLDQWTLRCIETAGLQGCHDRFLCQRGSLNHNEAAAIINGMLVGVIAGDAPDFASLPEHPVIPRVRIATTGTYFASVVVDLHPDKSLDFIHHLVPDMGPGWMGINAQIALPGQKRHQVSRRQIVRIIDPLTVLQTVFPGQAKADHMMAESPAAGRTHIQFNARQDEKTGRGQGRMNPISSMIGNRREVISH